MTFEDYLKEIHAQENPEILDDDMPDDYEMWLIDRTADEIIDYAEAWGRELLNTEPETFKEQYERIRNK